MMKPFGGHKAESAGGSFLPEDYVTRKADSRANFMCLFLFVVVMAGVVSAFFVTNRQWESVREEQAAINTAYEAESKKIDQLKALEDQRSTMLERAEITTALIEKAPRSLLTAELVTRMPEGITLLEANLASKRVVSKPVEAAGADVKSRSRTASSKSSKSKSSKSSKSAKGGAKAEEPAAPRPQAPKFETTLALVGVAGSNKEIADYLAGLKACGMLESVELAYIKETVMNNLTLRKFQIDAKVLASAAAVAPAPASAEGEPAGTDAGTTETTTTASAEPGKEG